MALSTSDTTTLFGRRSSLNDRTKSCMPLIFQRCTTPTSITAWSFTRCPIHHLPTSARCLKLSVTCLKEAGAPARVNLILPAGIAVDRNGNFLVADTNNGRIEKFAPAGTFLDIIGTKGSGQGQLGAPNGIAVDSTGNIYVADAGNHRVQKLSADGKLIAEWRGPDVGILWTAPDRHWPR